MREITEEIQQLYFVGELSKENCQDDWIVNLTTCDTLVTFKIDTGANATVIDEDTFKKMRSKVQLGPPDTQFVSPLGDLRCTGMFQTTTSYKDRLY